MNDTPDYEKLLDQLIAEREQLTSVINWVKQKLGRAEESETPKVQVMRDSTQPPRFPRIAAHAFFRMSVSDGIKAFLGYTNKTPQTARQITDGLVSGGLVFKAKNPYQTVFPTLARMEKETGEIAKLPDNTWGLAEWFSGARKAGGAEDGK